MALSKRELLQKYHKIACGDLFLASENYAMSRPEPGREEEWKAALAEVELLETWIKEMGGRIGA